MTDYTYYRDVFGGRYGTEIVPYLRRAYTVIRACITVPADDSMIADSVCIQAENMMDEGYDTVRLGSFSAKRAEKRYVCTEAMMNLEKYGLLYRGGIS